ncbi:uncharacterized protein AMSG_11666 [Thecamonas trahens ATCC 50062]|uniref:Uncharacterized protein n=1 Tax=Thecamonas trahens ATCC 50062 TaxID=461836 RepID=A0A0L0DTH7_THETB|nr:hypothetical protein AMSG_11666 [Thecamonas trahens ATCC 50062]KNC55527.1 hypothetical protein AMSG_11666 [Thecamonas trahens ATCC 50062]|eukprot:XP_013761472.1 hypothetical protein AMSG_11666 [Thecamonas trahens ATCC 50062]
MVGLVVVLAAVAVGAAGGEWVATVRHRGSARCVAGDTKTAAVDGLDEWHVTGTCWLHEGTRRYWRSDSVTIGYGVRIYRGCPERTCRTLCSTFEWWDADAAGRVLDEAHLRATGARRALQVPPRGADVGRVGDCVSDRELFGLEGDRYESWRVGGCVNSMGSLLANSPVPLQVTYPSADCGGAPIALRNISCFAAGSDMVRASCSAQASGELGLDFLAPCDARCGSCGTQWIQHPQRSTPLCKDTTPAVTGIDDRTFLRSSINQCDVRLLSGALTLRHPSITAFAALIVISCVAALFM